MEKKTGRPRKYKTPEELQRGVDLYFDNCGERGVPPTIAGLSRSLGYADRKSFTKQKYRSQEFHDIVTLARLRVMQYNEERLYNAETYPGAAFVLAANFGWKRGKVSEEEQEETYRPDVAITPAAYDPNRQAGYSPLSSANGNLLN